MSTKKIKVSQLARTTSVGLPSESLIYIVTPDGESYRSEAITVSEFFELAIPTGSSLSDRILAVNHGSDPTFPRPENSLIVYWVGTATPQNKIPADIWFNGNL